ncbi:MAG: nitroreductase [Clostridia bacterium]|nr:nitroreductase [Clostridia bacterium]
MDNPALQAILDRRSIRAYLPDPVTDGQVEQLEAAALAAPSAVNHQPWHFTFVRDAELLDEISRTVVESGGRDPSFHIFYHAPLVVFIAADSTRKWGVLDCGIAVENLALAAHAMGLGSVIVGMADAAFDAPGGSVLARHLGFPAGHRFAVSIAIGHPAAGKPPHENHPDRILRIG